MEAASGSAVASGSSASAESLRRGTRNRQPTRKAEALVLEAHEITGLSSTSKEVSGRPREAEAREQDHPAPTCDIQESEDDDEDEDDEDDGLTGDERYCVCRGKDDGSPMVWCGGCDDWFHFRCVGISQEAAEKLAEYMCQACHKSTGRVSKNLDGSISEISKKEAEAISRKSTKRKSPTTTEADNKKRKPSLSSLGSSHTKKNQPSQLGSPSLSSASHASASSRSPTSSSSTAQNDAVRSHVISRFATILAPIFAKEIDTDAVDNSAELSKKYAQQLEQGIFDAFAESSGGGNSSSGGGVGVGEGVGAGVGKKVVLVAGKGYKDRFRTLDFSLRDKGNDDLHARITSGALAAKVLATLPSEQLANASIRARTEKARQDSLHQSILKQQSGSGPLRKMTHKGEVVIEHDDAGPLNDSFSRVSRRPSPSRQVEDEETQGNNVLLSGTGEKVRTSSAASLDHKDAPGAVESTSHVDKLPLSSSNHESEAGSAPQVAKAFDFSNVWSASARKSDVQGDGETADEAGDTSEAVREEPPSGSAPSEEKYEPTKATDDFIDNFLQGIHSPRLEVPDQVPDRKEPQAAEASTTPTSTPPPPESAIIWRGAIHMPDEATISGTVRQIAGTILPISAEVASQLFPSLCSVIQGRLPTKTASDYLLQSRVASRTELIVFALRKSFEEAACKSAPQPTPSTQAGLDVSFEQMINYLSRRGRYGVILPAASAKGHMVKDFYVAPLPKDAPLPPWLELMKPREFIGKESSRDEDLILLVAVVFKNTLTAIRPSLPQTGTAGTVVDSHQAANGVGEGMFNGGSSALQDLLKAVGGPGAGGDGATPTSTSSSTPTLPPADPRFRRPQPQASILHNGGPANAEQDPVHAPSADVAAVLGALESSTGLTAAENSALAQVPSVDIQNVLQGNPGLLTSLLQSLGATPVAPDVGPNDAQRAGSVRPPGPPPGPPPRPPPSMPLTSVTQQNAYTLASNPYAGGPSAQWEQGQGQRPGPPPPPPPGLDPYAQPQANMNSYPMMPTAWGGPSGSAATTPSWPPPQQQSLQEPGSNFTAPMRGEGPPVRGGSFGKGGGRKKRRTSKS